MILQKRGSLILMAVLLVIGSFYVLTIREGHAWGDDFAGYLLHAKNIVEGRPYADTDYIYNPFFPGLGPKMYPPVFPLLLAPVWRIFGLNLTAFKVEMILVFLAFLFLLYLLFRQDLTLFSLLVLVMTVGFNPCFWEYKDEILSEIPFLFFVYLSLFVIDQADRNGKIKKAPVLWSLLITATILLCAGTRIIGIALIPCAFIVEWLIRKRPSKSALVLALPLAVFALLLLVTSYRFVSSYFEQFSFKPAGLLRNVIAYLKILGALWNNEHSKIFQYVTYVISLGFAGIGYVWRIKKKITALEVFPWLYFMCLILWPGYISIRGMMPIVPIFVFYIFSGLRVIDTRFRKPHPQFALILFMICIFISYAGFYSKTDFAAFPEGVEKRESAELFSFIRENTQKDDVFIFRKPRAFALYTGRRASVYYRSRNDKVLWEYFDRIKAKYIIVGRPFKGDQAFLRRFLARNQDKVRAIYANSDFEVFQIVGKP